jgi:uroporphyrin-3 C-methyltransferase
MTDQTTLETTPSGKKSSSLVSIGIFITTIGIVVLLGVFGFSYFQLSKVNVDMARTVTDLQQQLVTNQQQLTALQESFTAVQSVVKKSEEMSSQQEKVLADWRAAQQGDLNAWHAAEAHYLTQLANDQLQYTQNAQLASILLTQADTILKSLPDPRLLDIRKSIATDLDSLKAFSTVDVASLYLQLNTLNQQINQLTLPINPVKMEVATAQPLNLPADTPWWKAGYEYSMQALKKIVIVRNHDVSALPLVLPEEKLFLAQNLHAQFENAMWAVLHRDTTVYQASLTRAAAWVSQYYAQDAASTKSMLAALDELQKVKLQPGVDNLSNTLKLFDGYVAATSTAATSTSAQ